MEMLVKEKGFSKDFIIMVVGQIISILGSALLRFALSLFVLDITGRADLLLCFCYFKPTCFTYTIWWCSSRSF